MKPPTIWVTSKSKTLSQGGMGCNSAIRSKLPAQQEQQPCFCRDKVSALHLRTISRKAEVSLQEKANAKRVLRAQKSRPPLHSGRPAQSSQSSQEGLSPLLLTTFLKARSEVCTSYREKSLSSSQNTSETMSRTEPTLFKISCQLESLVLVTTGLFTRQS